MVNICSQTWPLTSMTQQCGTSALSVSWHSSHIESISRPPYNSTRSVHVSPWDLNTTVYIFVVIVLLFLKSIPRRKGNIFYILIKNLWTIDVLFLLKHFICLQNTWRPPRPHLALPPHAPLTHRSHMHPKDLIYRTDPPSIQYTLPPNRVRQIHGITRTLTVNRLSLPKTPTIALYHC